MTLTERLVHGFMVGFANMIAFVAAQVILTIAAFACVIIGIITLLIFGYNLFSVIMLAIAVLIVLLIALHRYSYLKPTPMPKTNVPLERLTEAAHQLHAISDQYGKSSNEYYSAYQQMRKDLGCDIAASEVIILEKNIE